VVGAGLAGALTARELTQAGYRVSIWDRKPGPGLGTSGNPAGLFKPILTREATLASRLSLLAFDYLLGWLDDRSTRGQAPRHSSRGLLQAATDATQAGRLKQALAERGWNSELAHWLDRDQLVARTRPFAPWGGVWFPRGGWIDPGDLCRVAIQEADSLLETCWSSPLPNDPARLREEAPGGFATDAVIFCTAQACRSLPELAAPRPGLSTQAIRGQISVVDLSDDAPASALSFKEYLIPLETSGQCLIGATHDRDDDSSIPRRPDHDRLLERLARRVPPHLLNRLRGAEPLSLRAGVRFTASHHAPLMGPLPITTKALGVPAWCLTALGSRGILFAPLLARSLSAQWSGGPDPLPEDLRRLLRPA
jgi:tRNA 5-methylaminomethyl-2-thiouridine biosynthesis bifunctional protein